MWGRTQLLRDPDTAHRIRAGGRNVHGPSGPQCLAAKEVPALHARPTAARPIAPTLHGIIHCTETLSWYSFVPRASGPELVPQQPREHSRSTALSSATAGQTQLSPPTLLSSGTPRPIAGTHQAPLRQQGPSAALTPTQPGELLLVSISR